MDRIKSFLEALGKSVDRLAAGNAVVAKPISIANRHVVPLCELKVAWGAGGGAGEGSDDRGKGQGGGSASGGAGAAKACPVAVVVVEDGKVRLESLGT